MRIFILYFIFFLFPIPGFSQVGSSDNTFAPNDVNMMSNQQTTISLIQPDGKVIIGGSFSYFNNVAQNRIVRLNTDGTTDASFSIETGFNNTLTAIALQSDGKIVAYGNFTSYNNTASNYIVRLNTNGSIDNTFNVGTGFNQSPVSSSPNSLAIQSDGKILVVGQFTQYNGTNVNRIVRLNTDGSIDNTFVMGTGFNSLALAVAVQSDNKILVAGQFSQYNGTARAGIIRLNADGTVDTGFTVGTGASGGFGVIGVKSFNVLSNGKIMIGGTFISYNGNACQYVARINSDGTFDNTFNTTGLGFVGSFTAVYTAKVQSSGKVLIGGIITSTNAQNTEGLFRLNTDGTFDNTFNIGTGVNLRGTNFVNRVNHISVASDDRIIVTGFFTSVNGTSRKNFARLNVDGAVDATFGNITGLNSPVFAMNAQTDGKIVVGGGFSFHNNVSYNNVARLNNDGNIDNTLNVGAGFENLGTNGVKSWINAVASQSDGKILVGGNFEKFNGVAKQDIVRLNTNGSIDANFAIPATLETDMSIVNSIVVRSDNKILVGASSSKGLLLLNEDGTIDNSFNNGGVGFANSYVNHIIQLSDGKLIVTGGFTSYNGTTYNRIILLNADGSIASGFSIGTGFDNETKQTVIQPDGKIIVVGNFTTYNGVAASRIVRLNADGTRDASFNVGTGFPSAVNTVALQSDGKILIGGAFLSYNGTNVLNLARLNADGSIDADFTTNTATNFAGGRGVDVRSIIVQGNKAIIGGTFTHYGSTVRNNILRINLCGNGSISPVTLSNAVIGTPYSQTLIATGLTGTLTWSVTSGALPAGLSLNPTTGLLSGTPTSGGSNFSFNIQASNGFCTATQVYNNFSTPLENPYFAQNTTIYPNPASDKVTISISDPRYKNVKINVLDNNGKLLKTIEAENTPQGIQMEINKFEAGLYYFQIESNKMTTTKKVIKR